MVNSMKRSVDRGMEIVRYKGYNRGLQKTIIEHVEPNDVVTRMVMNIQQLVKKEMKIDESNLAMGIG